MARPQSLLWQSVEVLGQTALADPVPITGITNANPAVVTAANSLAAGDYVLINSSIRELDGRVFRVANPTATEFSLEGENSTNYATFPTIPVEGDNSFQVITFGVSSRVIRSLSASGGEANYVDMTTIHDDMQVEAMGATTPLRYSLTALFSEDAFMDEMYLASNTKSDRAVLFRFPNGTELMGYFSVSATGAPTGSAGQPVETPFTLSAQSALKVIYV